MTIEDALKKAQEFGLDLVEIAPTATPPVCKIIDYGKYKYMQKKKEHEAKRKQVIVHIKEVKLRPNTDQHDLDFKLRHIRRFLEEGNKAKVTIVFRGREIAYRDQGDLLMKKILEELKDLAKVEYPAKMEGRAMVMVLGPA